MVQAPWFKMAGLVSAELPRPASTSKEQSQQGLEWKPKVVVLSSMGGFTSLQPRGQLVNLKNILLK